MKKTLLLLSALLVFTTCKKNKTETPTPDTTETPTETAAKGTISGKIKQRTATGMTYTLSLANVTISVDGQNKSAVTDDKGNYKINDVSAGILDFSIAGPEEMASKVQQVSFVGNGTLVLNAEIGRKTKDSLFGRIIDTTIAGKKYVHISMYDKVKYSTKSYFLALGKTSSIDPRNTSTFEYSSIGYVMYSNDTQQSKTDLYYDYNFISSLTGIKSGEQVYIAVFASSNNGLVWDAYSDKYFGFTTGAPMLPAVGFTMP